MEYRRLGKTDLEVSEISFGCWTMGGQNWTYGGQPTGWADPDEDEITAGVTVGLDAGVNHFDNADTYGNGRAERMLARVLDRLGVRSTDVVIATKVGWFPGTAEHAYEPAHIRHQCEQSLINLRRDSIDLYYFHHGDFGEGDRYLEDAVAVMNDLIDQGKVRFKGLSAYEEDEFERLVPVVQPHVLQTGASALHDEFIRPGSRMQKLMDEHGLSLVAFSPLAQGLLLDKFDPDDPPQFAAGDNRRNKRAFTKEGLLELKPKLEKVKSRFGGTTEELAAVTLNFVLAHPNVACVIPGFRNAQQAKTNVSAAGLKLSAEDAIFVREALV